MPPNDAACRTTAELFQPTLSGLLQVFHSIPTHLKLSIFPPQQISPPYSDLTCLSEVPSLLLLGFHGVSSPDFCKWRSSSPSLQLFLLECGWHHFGNLWLLPQRITLLLTKRTDGINTAFQSLFVPFSFSACSGCQVLGNGAKYRGRLQFISGSSCSYDAPFVTPIWA